MTTWPSWLKQWVIVSAMSWATGVAAERIAWNIAWFNFQLNMGWSTLAGVVARVIVTGLLMGISQCLVLRPITPNPRLWGLATIGGWVSGLIVGLLAFAALVVLFEKAVVAMEPGASEGASWYRHMMFAFIAEPLAIGLGWVAIGVMVGVAQWLTLRQWVRQKSKWIVTTMKGWIGGLILYSILNSIAGRVIPDYGYPATFFATALWIFTGAFLGGVYGAIVGVTTGNRMKSLIA